MFFKKLFLALFIAACFAPSWGILAACALALGLAALEDAHKPPVA